MESAESEAAAPEATAAGTADAEPADIEPPTPGPPETGPAETELSAVAADCAGEEDAPARPKHLSATSTAMFRQCPQRWKFRYIDKLPDPPGEAALAGTFAHRVLEALLAHEADDRTIDRARSLATELWAEMLADADFEALELDDDGIRNLKWTAWRAIEGLWDIEDPTEVDLVATEAEVSVEIGNVPFYGFIDRVEATPDGAVISDYKSGRAPRPRFADGRLEQVLLYAAAFAELEGTLPARARLMYLGQKIIETEVTAEAIEDVTVRLAETWDELLTRWADDDFPPKPGPLCGWCAFVRHCPDGMAEVQRRHATGLLRPDVPALAEAG